MSAWDPEETHELVARLRGVGVVLRLDGDALVVEGPTDRLPRAMREQLRARREDLRRHLRGENVCGVRFNPDGRGGYRYQMTPPPESRPATVFAIGSFGPDDW